MSKMSDLQHEAQQSARFRNHNLDRFHKVGDHKSVARCVRCGAEVDCNTKPLPNEIDIGGEAVAVNCPGSREALESMRERWR